MQVAVRYFASTREAAGLEGETLEVEAGTTVAALKAQLAARHPALATLLDGTRVAVGADFAADDATLSDGDEVALIPPVSGG